MTIIGEMGFKFYWKLIPGQNNSAPYNLKVLQIVRQPKEPENAYRIPENELNHTEIKLATGETLFESFEPAILIPGDNNYWDGKFVVPWVVQRGTIINVWTDSLTEYFHLICEVLERPMKQVLSHFKVQELKVNEHTSITFPGRVILKWLLFYDLYKYDRRSGNEAW